MKWQPDTEPHVFLNANEHYDELDVPQFFETADGPSLIGPYPLPPRPPRSQLEPGVEEWRKARLRMINEQLDLWKFTAISRSGTMAAVPVVQFLVDANAMHSHSNDSHRALCVPELLEAMLCPLDPESQYRCWNVSRFWRVTITYILGPEFREQPHVSPSNTLNILLPTIRPCVQEQKSSQT